MLPTFLAAVGTAVMCVLLHYEMLRLISCLSAKLQIAPRPRILCVVLGALIAHLLEIALFAGALLLLGVGLGLQISQGGLAISLSYEEALYISSESYASLGSSAVYPVGPLRVFAGIEALTGLLLVGWTTAYTFLAMSNLWNEH